MAHIHPIGVRCRASSVNAKRYESKKGYEFHNNTPSLRCIEPNVPKITISDKEEPKIVGLKNLTVAWATLIYALSKDNPEFLENFQQCNEELLQVLKNFEKLPHQSQNQILSFYQNVERLFELLNAGA